MAANNDYDCRKNNHQYSDECVLQIYFFLYFKKEWSCANFIAK